MFFSKAREPMNSFTHSLGAVLSAIGTVFILLKCLTDGVSAQTTITCLIFCASLILLYSASGRYHYVSGSKEKILHCKRVDHAMIYVLIAGSYTPILFSIMPVPQSMYYIGLVWGIGTIGAILKIILINMPRWLGSGIYIAMGWIIVFFPSALKKLSTTAFVLLLLGGISYTIGGLIYWLKKPNFLGKFGFHEVFHIFIMVGSLLHYLMVYIFIA